MSWVEYAYADWGDSGYVPPSTPAYRRSSVEGLPDPAYVTDQDHSVGTQWAAIIIGLALQAFGDNLKGNGGSGPSSARWCPTCGCGWTADIEPVVDGKRQPVPCWFCHPQPAPRLILPGDTRSGLP